MRLSRLHSRMGRNCCGGRDGLSVTHERAGPWRREADEFELGCGCHWRQAVSAILSGGRRSLIRASLLCVGRDISIVCSCLLVDMLLIEEQGGGIPRRLASGFDGIGF